MGIIENCSENKFWKFSTCQKLSKAHRLWCQYSLPCCRGAFCFYRHYSANTHYSKHFQVPLHGFLRYFERSRLSGIFHEMMHAMTTFSLIIPSEFHNTTQSSKSIHYSHSPLVLPYPHCCHHNYLGFCCTTSGGLEKICFHCTTAGLGAYFSNGHDIPSQSSDGASLVGCC